MRHRHVPPTRSLRAVAGSSMNLRRQGVDRSEKTPDHQMTDGGEGDATGKRPRGGSPRRRARRAERASPARGSGPTTGAISTVPLASSTARRSMPSTKLAPRGLTSAASLRTEHGTALTSPAPRCAHTPMPFGAASVTRVARDSVLSFGSAVRCGRRPPRARSRQPPAPATGIDGLRRNAGVGTRSGERESARAHGSCCAPTGTSRTPSRPSASRVSGDAEVGHRALLVGVCCGDDDLFVHVSERRGWAARRRPTVRRSSSTSPSASARKPENCPPRRWSAIRRRGTTGSSRRPPSAAGPRVSSGTAGSAPRAR